VTMCKGRIVPVFGESFVPGKTIPEEGTVEPSSDKIQQGRFCDITVFCRDCSPIPLVLPTLDESKEQKPPVEKSVPESPGFRVPSYSVLGTDRIEPDLTESKESIPSFMRSRKVSINHKTEDSNLGSHFE
jgi:hypothetical protein